MLFRRKNKVVCRNPEKHGKDIVSKALFLE
jgi:hypothetical protein